MGGLFDHEPPTYEETCEKIARREAEDRALRHNGFGSNGSGRRKGAATPGAKARKGKDHMSIVERTTEEQLRASLDGEKQPPPLNGSPSAISGGPGGPSGPEVGQEQENLKQALLLRGHLNLPGMRGVRL